MAEIVNLRRARKAKLREAREVDAAANRAKFGETKAARKTREAAEDKARRLLDGLKREPSGE